jgi:hypothetical protein
MPYEPQHHRLVFVGGLHRSGTTLLGRLLAAHRDVSGFADTGVPADEGQHLQAVYPSARTFGGPGRFGFAAGAYLTEASELATEQNAGRILASWEPHWDLTRRILIEKSPPNLIRTRFLQALYPEASFVVITRHPAAVALATQKWSNTSLPSLVRHWLACHEAFEQDRQHLERLHVVSYEELVAGPQLVLDGLFEFLGLPAQEIETDLNDGNAHYFACWEALARSPLGALPVARARLLYGRRVARFGYGLGELGPRRPAKSTR